MMRYLVAMIATALMLALGAPPAMADDGAIVVPSGVVHLMELQEQGWSYVRP